MTVVSIILIILLALLIGIALLTVRIIIDTVQDKYEVRVLPIAWARLVFEEERIGVMWRALFFGGTVQVFPPPEGKKKTNKEGKNALPKKREAKEVKEKRKKRSMRLADMQRLAEQLWRGLRVRRFHLRLNTDDPVWNAWLFPAFMFWRSKGYDVAIQWVGDSELIVDMEHSVHRVARAFIKTFILKPTKR